MSAPSEARAGCRRGVRRASASRRLTARAVVARLSASSLAVTFLLGTTTSALACPVCFAAKNEESRQAFINATAFMTAAPLLVIGAIVLWVWWRFRCIALEEQAALEEEVALGRAAHHETEARETKSEETVAGAFLGADPTTMR